ncbi:anti-sigma factor [Bacillus sp. ISL-39]|uniref:anti-sigma factor n=1 Tax=Bacillus sp. ISL-39 TaxID=2819124 RepID=UPI001BE9C4F3|nr:anti-sigma factor [Bacillus sp. ISL-39]MBT2639761.1 anti-sigma factor [Bacillus sp. ISL-39]
MTDHKTCECLLDYFNNTLTDEEKSLFENHLATCKDCRDELEELNMLTADLPFSAELAEPIEGMKDRILASVFEETEKAEEFEKPVKIKEFEKPVKIKEFEKPVKTEEIEEPVETKGTKRRSYRWLQPLLAASLLLSLSANAYFYLNQNSQEFRNPSREGTDVIVKQVQLAVSEGYEGNAEAAMIKKEEGMALVVQASNLKPLTGNEAYQVWLIDEAGEKFRAGTFRTNSEGTGAVSYSVNYEGEHNWTTIAVTLEPTPDSKQPKGDIVLASQL